MTEHDDRPTDAGSTRVDKPRIAFITEQHVGLRTYSENLRRFADLDERITPIWRPVTYVDEGGWIEKLRFLPSGMRGSIRGRLQVRRAIREIDADACLYMTQTPAALGGKLVLKSPFVIMVDDTPRLFDRMAAHYDSPPDRFRALRWFKHRANVTVFRAARTVLPMSEWAGRSLVDDYGVQPGRIRVAPTGIDLSVWKPGERSDDGPMRVLFVGGHFARKGGPELLDAFDRLDPRSVELHLVTRDDVAARDCVHVHTMQPNSPELIELYRSCDVFVLPSFGEAFPNVVVEAHAAGLACIVTNVGGMAEMVVEGETGFVIDPGDVDALAGALKRLANDPDERRRMGAAARARAEQLYDGRSNAARVVDDLLAAINR